MDIDSELRHRGEFPVDKPMEALKADHHFVREYFNRYFQCQDEDEKKSVGRHILLLLEMHTSLEEGVFYPRVREVDATLVEHCEQEHEQVKQMVERLKLMDESDPQAEWSFHQLADALFKHIDAEEQQLFPKIGQANLDLTAIGQEMQTFEITMIADRLQKPVAPGIRI